MTVEDGVNGAASWDFYFRGQSSKEALPDLAGAPVGFLALGGDDGRFELLGQLGCISVGAPGPIRDPPPVRIPHNVRRSYSRFCGRSETRGTARSCSPRL